MTCQSYYRKYLYSIVMFSRLFSQTGLSLERLRALVEVGAYGSIVKAAEGQPARQSLYSRQIKELEDFFEVPLLERQGRGVRLTAPGRELSRISRFFLLGLSNFQRGCLAEGQSYRIGADPTFKHEFLIRVLAAATAANRDLHFSMETVTGEEVERRLHDLTVDFGVVTDGVLSRPLQTRLLGSWPWALWVPRSFAKTQAEAERALKSKAVALASTGSEIEQQLLAHWIQDHEPTLICASFLEVRDVLAAGKTAGLLPSFLAPADSARRFVKLAVGPGQPQLSYHLAWNPRLLRLNPHAGRRRDQLVRALSAETAKR